MRIKRIMGGMALFIAILIVGSGAWAMTYTDHVSTAPNGQGDVLIYPLYVATDGWESSISVINTSNQSVVAKIVFRSYAYSQELLDFMIYMSPFDMWVGKIRVGDKGLGVYSVDGSALYDSGIDMFSIPEPFATPINPMKAPFAKITCVTAPYDKDLATMGYITLIEAWSGNVPFTIEEAADMQKRGKAIATQYNLAIVPNTINALSGSIDVSYPNGGAAAMAAVALKNYKNATKLVVGKTNAFGLDTANNNMTELEAALSKGIISVPFDNNDIVETWHGFTFPTKGSIGCPDPITGKYNTSSLWFHNTTSVPFLLDEYDIDEKKAADPFSPPKAYKLPYEFWYISAGDAIFEQGWMQYTLQGAPLPGGVNNSLQPLDYTGTPVIPIVINFINDGIFPKMTFKNASFTDSVVSGAAGPLPDYQYTSSYATTR